MGFLGKSPAAILLAIMVGTYVLDHYIPVSRPQPAGSTAPGLAQTAPLSASETPTHLVAGDTMGNYVAPVRVDGHEVHMLVDTGATFVSLTSEDAETLGIHPGPADYKLKLNSAEGTTTVAQMRLPCVRVGDIVVRDVDAIVMAPGAASGSLLGMSFLRRLGRFGVADGQMTLEQ
jgi:aspartyl protease family protein